MTYLLVFTEVHRRLYDQRQVCTSFFLTNNTGTFEIGVVPGITSIANFTSRSEGVPSGTEEFAIYSEALSRLTLAEIEVLYVDGPHV